MEAVVSEEFPFVIGFSNVYESVYESKSAPVKVVIQDRGIAYSINIAASTSQEVLQIVKEYWEEYKAETREFTRLFWQMLQNPSLIYEETSIVWKDIKQNARQQSREGLLLLIGF